MAARLPSPAASIRAVVPSSVVARGSAPASASRRIMPASADLAATRNGVDPIWVSRPEPGDVKTPISNALVSRCGRSRRASGSAPRASSASAAAGWPVAAATCKAAYPASAGCGSAPASINCSAMAVWRLVRASIRAVTPSGPASSTSAPAAIRIPTDSASPASTA